jgi:hypothetical protein
MKKYRVSSEMATNVEGYRNLCYLRDDIVQLDRLNEINFYTGAEVDGETYGYLKACSFAYAEHRQMQALSKKKGG